MSDQEQEAHFIAELKTIHEAETALGQRVEAYFSPKYDAMVEANRNPKDIRTLIDRMPDGVERFYMIANLNKYRKTYIGS